MGDFIMTTCSYIFKNINQRTYDFHKQNELEKKTNCATCIYQIPRTKFSQIKVSDKYLSHRFFFSIHFVHENHISSMFQKLSLFSIHYCETNPKVPCIQVMTIRSLRKRPLVHILYIYDVFNPCTCFSMTKPH